MQQQDNLILKAANLAKASPQQWRDFLDALAAYTEIHKDNLIKSPLPELPVNQGRAQGLTTLHKVLSEAVASADKIKGTR